jgi:hypothetical protein
VTNSALQIKVRERINKLSSNDYTNIECWQIVESFNKAQIEWIRRQIRGGNVYQDGDEQSSRRIDDLQRLLKPIKLPIIDRGIFYETVSELPSDYLEYKRIDVSGISECCEDGRPMNVYLAEEDNRAQLLRDDMKKPSFEWAETFATLINNKARIFTNDEFKLEKAELTYYRFPVYIQIESCVDPYTGLASPADIECEFKDDIVELLIDEAVSILAGDIESGGQQGRGSNSAERSN